MHFFGDALATLENDGLMGFIALVQRIAPAATPATVL